MVEIIFFYTFSYIHSRKKDMNVMYSHMNMCSTEQKMIM